MQFHGSYSEVDCGFRSWSVVFWVSSCYANCTGCISSRYFHSPSWFDSALFTSRLCAYVVAMFWHISAVVTALWSSYRGVQYKFLKKKYSWIPSSLLSVRRFPGFSKSGPELYLLCKQFTKGKERVPIYVGYVLSTSKPFFLIQTQGSRYLTFL